MKGKEILKFMKKIKKISLLFASVALLVVTLFSGNNEVKVNAEGETAYKELTFPDDNKDNNKVNNYTSEWEAKIGEDTYKIANASNFRWTNWTYIKFGNKTGDSIGSIITPIFAESVSSVTLTIDAVTTKYVNSINISTADSNSASKWQWSDPIEFTIQKGETTANLPVPLKNKSYKIEFDCKESNNNGMITLSKVSFYKEADIDLTNYENITKLISDIGTVEYSSLCKAKIQKARDAYNDATSDVQKQVEDAAENNLSILKNAETEYAQKETIAKSNANNAVAMIDRLPETINENVLNANYKSIIAAKSAFNSLTRAEKSLIDNEKINKLENILLELSKYSLSIAVIEDGKLNNNFAVNNADTAKEGATNKKNWYGIYGDNKITSSTINTLLDELEINYTFTIGRYGAYNSTAHRITLAAYSNNVLVSNVVTIQIEKTTSDMTTFNGSFILNTGVKSFNLVINSNSESSTGKFTKIYDASFSYVSFNSAAKFIEDWAALRAKGGDQGICYYLTKETRAELDAMISRYSKFTGDDKAEIDNTSDGGTTIANTIEYVSSLLAKLDNTTPSKEESGLIISSINNYDKSSLIALFVVLGIITISGYFIIEKKKSIR